MGYIADLICIWAMEYRNFGTWNLELGIWNLKFGIWYLNLELFGYDECSDDGQKLVEFGI